MKLEMKRAELLEHLAVVSTVADRSEKNGVYSCVLIECVKDLLMLACSDQTVTVRREADCDCKPGTVALDAKRLQQILGSMSGDSVTIESTKAGVVIKSLNSRFTLQNHASAAAAIASRVGEKAEWGDSIIEVRGEALGNALGQVAWSVDDLPISRYALGAVAVEMNGSQLWCVATNSRTLAVARVTARGSDDDDIRLWPLRLVAAVRAAFTTPADVIITRNASSVRITDGTTTIRGQLVSGVFPAWGSVLPKREEMGEAFRAKAGELLSLVRQARVCTSVESSGIDWRFDKNGLTLASQAAEIGSGEVRLESGGIQSAVTVTLDGELCQRILASVEKEGSVTVWVRDGENAVVFETDSTDSTRFMIMPMSKGA
jgi:DNA polymerase III sliding clamp (beta) subunit (PCNA family)